MKYLILFFLLTGCASGWQNAVDNYQNEKSKSYSQQVDCRMSIRAHIAEGKMTEKEIRSACAEMYPPPDIPEICNKVGIEK